jgi:hypothetical protein
MMRTTAFLFATLLAGCGDGNGDDVGVFQVKGARTESCGDSGLLASAPEMQLKVWIRRVGESAVHWDDGTGKMIGQYDGTKRTFVTQRSVVADMREDFPSGLPCSIERVQKIEVTLDADPTVAKSFSGEMRYDYVPTEGSDCQDLVVGDTAIARELPCSVAYDLDGERP